MVSLVLPDFNENLGERISEVDLISVLMRSEMFDIVCLANTSKGDQTCKNKHAKKKHGNIYMLTG